MILLTIDLRKDSYYRFHKKIVYCENNNFIESIEYIDNKFIETIIKFKNKYSIDYLNLTHEFHNPIGPARIIFNKNGSIKNKHYYEYGVHKKQKQCYDNCNNKQRTF